MAYTVQKFGEVFVGGKSKKMKTNTYAEAIEKASFFPNLRTVIKKVR